MPSISPLRYPGGKAKLYQYVRSLLECNGLLGKTYIEPFAGGAGLALKLLANDDAGRIIINDFDPAIYCFWSCVINQTDGLCNLIEKTPVSPQEWARQKAIYMQGYRDNLLDYGFATFFLNRTNVSGILTGGMIGGLDQTGQYRLNARFNKEDLINRIQMIGRMKRRIVLTNLDAKVFLNGENMRHYYNAFLNLDPPYVKKSNKLYKNAFSADDHRELFEIVHQCKRKWIVTYDVCDLVKELYAHHRSSYLSVSYSVKSTRKARELVFFSDNLELPDSIVLN